ncbi:hypothetical protein C9374_003687 [Naegleria lovaniensis]|uniref:Uncharacterized protein n=1 Tax=Naegleria lovaniensis TaxID=51637 RepID=A0AA88KQ61_NAELO|nr:uncharacterized protein C9374_003687 [Naegleria lovaniensis]KAG2393923.1 hypothetical protein C9374_003687 [Naegleria lovaniensis]
MHLSRELLGNEFSTHRLIPLRNAMKNPRISFIDDKFCQITYEDSARNVYRTVMVAFTSESDYTISTAVEGIHFAIGPLSPSSWNVMTPNNCLFVHSSFAES